VTAIAMPKLGMTMEEGTVVQWPLDVGEAVAKGQVVLVIESEKTEVEIEATAGGVLRHVYVEEGETVPCGTLLGAITDDAEAPFDADAFRAARVPAKEEAASEAPEARRPAAREGAAGGSGAHAGASERRPVAPAARALARKLGLELDRIGGSGPGGRVTKKDVQAFAAAREALVPVDEDVSLEVLTEGDGDPVLLLPGLGTDVSAFARQTPMLAERFRVLGVNPRGVGHSDAPEAFAYEVPRMAADAAATWTGAAHVIGASLGAAAAIELALAFPERVRSLTLITPFLEASPRLHAVADAWVRCARVADSETLAAVLLPWLFSPGYLADEAVRERTRRGLAATVARAPADGVARAAAGLARWSGTRGAADLATIAVPTLVIGAGGDLLTPGAAALAEAIPGSTCRVVPEAGHAVALEAGDAVNDALAAHLG